MQQQRSVAEEEEDRQSLAKPSFRRILQDSQSPGSSATVSVESPRSALAVERLHGLNAADPPVEDECDGGDDDGGGSEDFEFAVVPRDCLDALDAVTADEIFSDGLIRPVYPLFNRALVFDGGELPRQARDGGGQAREAENPAGVPLQDLMMVDRERPSASTSREADDLDGVPAGSFCVWTPRSAPSSPNLRKKSHSTGAAAAKRWSLCQLVPGRSRSDGKEKLASVVPPTEQQSDRSSRDKSESPSWDAAAAGEEKKGGGRERGRGRTSELDVVTAYQLYYARGVPAPRARRRSFLPYRSGWGFPPA